MQATHIIWKHVFYPVVLCGNNVYTFITGAPVKQYTVDNIIMERLIQYLISGTITKCYKCHIKYSISLICHICGNLF